MYIIPMSGITPINSMSQTETPDKVGESASFTDIFKQAVKDVQDTGKVCEEDSIKAALGEIDDLHTVQINLEKAATAMQVLVSMKNTAVESYNEIMRMSI